MYSYVCESDILGLGGLGVLLEWLRVCCGDCGTDLCVSLGLSLESSSGGSLLLSQLVQYRVLADSLPLAELLHRVGGPCRALAMDMQARLD